MRTLWMKVATTSFEPTNANIVEWSYWPQVDGVFCLKGMRTLHIQPILHEEDRILGEFNADYYAGVYSMQSEDPRKKLDVFSLEGHPLFLYCKEVSSNLPNPDPQSWLLGEGALMPKVAVASVMEDLAAQAGDSRWTIAGYSCDFEYTVLKGWLSRVFGGDAVEHSILDQINGHYQLDMLTVVRFLHSFGKVNPPFGFFNLDKVMQEYGVPPTKETSGKLKFITDMAKGVFDGDGNS